MGEDREGVLERPVLKILLNFDKIFLKGLIFICFDFSEKIPLAIKIQGIMNYELL